MTTKTAAARTMGLQIHAFTFLATMVLLAAIDVAAGGHYWVQWPLLGWGIGLFAHWFFTAGPAGKPVDTAQG